MTDMQAFRGGSEMAVVDNLVQDVVLKGHAKRGIGREIMLGN
jgi:hypothetical protein